MNTEPGIKHDANKPAWDLLPMREVEEVVRVLTHGRDKYSADNWKRIPDAPRRYYAAAMRHLAAWHANYEDGLGAINDPESGRSHLAHAISNLFFLMWHDRQDGAWMEDKA